MRERDVLLAPPVILLGGQSCSPCSRTSVDSKCDHSSEKQTEILEHHKTNYVLTRNKNQQEK